MLQDTLAGEFVIGGAALLPLVVLLVLSVRRVPAEPSMLASVGVAVVLAAVVTYFFIADRDTEVDALPPVVRDIVEAAESDVLSESYDRSYALVVGIDRYPESIWPDLSYATVDARGIAELLERRGFEVTTLYDAGATKAAILTHLENELAPTLEPDDRVVFFFAGHHQVKAVRSEVDCGELLHYSGSATPGSGLAPASGFDHDIADVSFSDESLLRRGQLRQREGLRKQRPESIALDQPDQARHDPGRHDGGAGQLQILVHQLA